MQNRKSVRDIIVDAMDQARIVKRNQPIPGDLFVSALMLLKDRIAEYGNTNYLQFLRKEINFTPDKPVLTVGDWLLKDEYTNEVEVVENMIDIPPVEYMKRVFVKSERKLFVGSPEGEWMDGGDGKYLFENYPDIYAPKLQEITRVFIRPKNSPAMYDRNWHELKFVAYEDFYDFDRQRNIFTVVPEGDTFQKLMFREQMIESGYDVKLVYNEHYEIDEDTVLNIPGQFIALFTAALVVDLARQFPRMSDSTVTLLQERLSKMEENVRRSSSVNKFIGRNINNQVPLCYDTFADGSYLGL